MRQEFHIPVFDLLMSVSDVLDLMSSAMTRHHLQVAYAANAIGSELGLSASRRAELVIAGALHDIGAFSLAERLDILHFEEDSPHMHGHIGYLLMKAFSPFTASASFVRYHHIPWGEGEGEEHEGGPVPMGSHILHLADRLAVLINRRRPALLQSKSICREIETRSGRVFAPDVVKALKACAIRESFWFDIESASLGAILRRDVRMETVVLTMQGLLELTGLFRRIIDFRSRFTACHSSGVAACAVALARLTGFSEGECLTMKAASHVHDLGKLAIPRELLEKPKRLTGQQFSIMKAHVYHTHRVLEPIPDLNTVRIWGSLHQERLDGTGYPFGLTGAELPLGARVLAVADVFTALAEDRPYRKGLPLDETLRILREYSLRNKLDGDIVARLAAHVDEVNALRIEAQGASAQDYEDFLREQ